MPRFNKQPFCPQPLLLRGRPYVPSAVIDVIISHDLQQVSSLLEAAERTPPAICLPLKRPAFGCFICFTICMNFFFFSFHMQLLSFHPVPHTNNITLQEQVPKRSNTSLRGPHCTALWWIFEWTFLSLLSYIERWFSQSMSFSPVPLIPQTAVPDCMLDICPSLYDGPHHHYPL